MCKTETLSLRWKIEEICRIENYCLDSVWSVYMYVTNKIKFHSYSMTRRIFVSSKAFACHWRRHCQNNFFLFLIRLIWHRRAYIYTTHSNVWCNCSLVIVMSANFFHISHACFCFNFFLKMWLRLNMNFLYLMYIFFL